MKNISLSFKYIPYAYDLDSEAIEFSMSVGEHMTIYELKKKLQEYFVKGHFKSNKERAQEWIHPFLTILQNHKQDSTKQSLDIIGDGRFVKSMMQENSQILAYEREPYSRIGFSTGDSMKSFVLIEIKM